MPPTQNSADAPRVAVCYPSGGATPIRWGVRVSADCQDALLTATFSREAKRASAAAPPGVHVSDRGIGPRRQTKGLTAVWGHIN